jgi:hypothetical protein
MLMPEAAMNHLQMSKGTRDATLHHLHRYLKEYIRRAGIAEDRKAPLFRSTPGRSASTIDAMTKYRSMRSSGSGIEYFERMS